MEKSNFSLAQTLIEANLFDKKIKSAELYELYFTALERQSLRIDSYKILDFVDLIFIVDTAKALLWLEKIKDSKIINSQRYLYTEIKLAEKLGQLEKVYQLVCNYNIQSIERKNPIIPADIDNLINKFFLDDFNLKLQRLSLSFLRNDLDTSEIILKDLILSCYERSNTKGQNLKLKNILEILRLEESNQKFRIYKDLLGFLLKETDKSQGYKRLIECIIYFDEFKLQVLILEVLNSLEATTAKSYGKVIRTHKDYDFVYLDKYFSHLKKYFIELPKKSKEKPIEDIKIDLTSIEASDSPLMGSFYEHVDEEEIYFVRQIKNESFSVETLIDFATTLMQSDCLYACEETLKLAQTQVSKDFDILRVRYLYVTCLLKRRDYRASLDMILDTLPMCKSENDLLSFLYAESEVYIRLEENQNAINVLKKIVTMDSSYRLAKDRLDKLNEI